MMDMLELFFMHGSKKYMMEQSTSQVECKASTQTICEVMWIETSEDFAWNYNAKAYSNILW